MSEPVLSPAIDEFIKQYQTGEDAGARWAWALMGRFELLEWKWGEIRANWHAEERHTPPGGVLFGGAIASLADHAGYFAAITVMDGPIPVVRTARLETDFFRPLQHGAIPIVGRVVNRSRSLVHVEIDVLTADDKLAVRSRLIQVPQKSG